jgi:hypothetical protein
MAKLDKRLLLLGAAGLGLYALSRSGSGAPGAPGGAGRYPFQGRLPDGRIVTVTGSIPQSQTRDSEGNVRPIGQVGQLRTPDGLATFVEVVAG